jgi:hypothetical protein
MLRTLIIGALLLTTAGLVLAAPPKEPAKNEPPPIPVTPLPIHTAPPPARALLYGLLPDDLDLVRGNAAPFWLRAGDLVQHGKGKLTEKEHAWTDTEKTPLKDLPRKEVQELLDAFRPALSLAEQAARQDHCDWELPPLTIQTLELLPMNEVQSLRELTQVLSIQMRLHLAEGRLDKAVQTMQIGLALARDMGNGPTLIHSLVGLAIEAIVLGRLEEIMQRPETPNFYWPLSALPTPLIDMRRTLRTELGTLHRSFPQLRHLEQEGLTAAQAESLVEKLAQALAINNSGKEMTPVANKLAIAALTTRIYAEAKQWLLAHGRNAEKVEAMPAVQAVVLYLLEQYDLERDEILKWATLPPWQARVGFAELEKRFRDDRQRREGNVFVYLLMPAIAKVNDAEMRLQRRVAGLRCVEAIRLYAAGHDGKLPPTLAEITEVPLPIDPVTGKGFDAFYERSDDHHAALTVPAAPGQPAIVGRRYELSGNR